MYFTQPSSKQMLLLPVSKVYWDADYKLPLLDPILNLAGKTRLKKFSQTLWFLLFCCGRLFWALLRSIKALFRLWFLALSVVFLFFALRDFWGEVYSFGP